MRRGEPLYNHQPLKDYWQQRRAQYPHDERIVRAWREAALADGWTGRGLYEPHESADRAIRIEKQGFVAHILIRPPEAKNPDGSGFVGEANITVWAPDGMQIKPPEVYDWVEIEDSVQVCLNCGKRVQAEDIHRYSFAGRCCGECLPEMQKKHEFRGWTS